MRKNKKVFDSKVLLLGVFILLSMMCGRLYAADNHTIAFSKGLPMGTPLARWKIYERKPALTEHHEHKANI